MLVATINPPAKKVIQPTPFSTQELTANQMIVKCTKLVIGGDPTSNADKVNFDVRFGTVKYQPALNGGQGDPYFEILVHYNTTLTQQELSGWGTDDTVVYGIIAQKLGFQVTQLQDVPGLNYTN